MTIQPKGEDLRKAVKWVAEERTHNPEKRIKKIIEEACLKFNLSPMEADFLLRKFITQD